VDVGSTSKLAENFDWTLAKKKYSQWNPLQPIAATDLEAESAIRRRAEKLTRYLLSRPEDSITLVSHGAFLMRLTGGSYMDNCEVRTYEVTSDKWILKKAYRLSKNV